MKRGALAGVALAAVLVASPAITRAQAPAAPPSDVAVEAVPMFGASGAIAWGWNQVVVRIQNNRTKPLRGNVEITAGQFGRERSFHATAPYSVGAGASVHVRVPVRVVLFGEVRVRVLEGDGESPPFAEATLSAFKPSGALLVDVSETSRLRGVIGDVPLSFLFSAPGTSTSGASPPTLTVGTPRFDPATGDPMLPDRTALYSSADAVTVRSDLLSRVGGAELDALAGFVLAGGTLAIAVVRPEDVRHPTLTAFAGGAITRRGVSSEALRELDPPPSSSSFGAPSGKSIPAAKSPTSDVSETLAGYYGGNLHGSAFGTSATYGMGEVHFLAFDPTRKPAVDDPWVQIRMVDLTRRAHDRRSTQIFRPGNDLVGDYDHVRQQLDPNQSSRWAIGVAALLLCLYAVVAGPVNFSLASRAGRPLRALRHLPIYAAATFAIIVALGMFAKGINGRARHLTLIEAGGGMTKGSALRWRGFFSSRAKELTVHTTDGSSVLSTASISDSINDEDHLLVDRDGARLVDVAALPWQTVVVREHGFASLGEGVALVRAGSAGVSVVNRSGRNLRGAILRLPDGSSFYAAKLADGDRIDSSAMTPIAGNTTWSPWEARITTTTRAGSIELHTLAASDLHAGLEGDAPGLADAWRAIEEAAGYAVDWFPDGVPVLLGQLDGGEGRTFDAGLRIESDRLLVRVVGFGGAP
ncbi:MAG: hypothetical protein ABI134_15345 [Byssovorax sp.]